MKITINGRTEIDTIETEDFINTDWNGVYEYVQKILDANGTNDVFYEPIESDAWNGMQWLEFADSL